MIKVIAAYITVLFFVTSSCKKENLDDSPSGILKRHEWNEYKFREITYDITGASPVLKKDTTYYAPDCIQQSKYKFQRDSLISYTSKCQINNNFFTGKWFLRQDNYLQASLPRIVNGQTYYFGIVGFITFIDDTMFETRASQVFGYTFLQNGNAVFVKDSTVKYNTYRN